MKKSNLFSELVDEKTVAPHGRCKAGKPIHPGRKNLIAYNERRKAEKAKEIKEFGEEVSKAPDNTLLSLQKELYRLGKESIRTLRAGLKDSDIKVRIQAATAATRTSVLGLAKDMWVGDGLSPISIHTQEEQPTETTPTGTQAQALDPLPGAETLHPRTGKPVTIIR